jgi:hypothetical protein
MNNFISIKLLFFRYSGSLDGQLIQLLQLQAVLKYLRPRTKYLRSSYVYSRLRKAHSTDTHTTGGECVKIMCYVRPSTMHPRQIRLD